MAASYGNYCVVCYGAEEAIGILKGYCGLQRIDTGQQENMMTHPNLSVLKDGKAVKTL